MKVAIVHDWLTNYGGAETFVELLLKIYPDADIFTLVYDKKSLKIILKTIRFIRRAYKISRLPQKFIPNY